MRPDLQNFGSLSGAPPFPQASGQKQGYLGLLRCYAPFISRCLKKGFLSSSNGISLVTSSPVPVISLREIFPTISIKTYRVLKRLRHVAMALKNSVPNKLAFRSKWPRYLASMALGRMVTRRSKAVDHL